MLHAAIFGLRVPMWMRLARRKRMGKARASKGRFQARVGSREQGESLTHSAKEREGTTLDSPLKWHGGKHYLREWHRSMVPPHVHYVETHAGALSMLLAVSGEGVSEVVNDIHGPLTNFWRVLACPEMFQEFRRTVEATPFSKPEWERSDRAVTNWEIWTQAQAAAYFFILCRQSRQGLMKDFATLSKTRTRRGMNEQASAWLTAVEGLPEIHARLKRVVVYNEDANVVIRREDGPTTFFYCDPPYRHETRETTGDYEHEMTDAHHEELLATLGAADGRFMLCGYPSAMYTGYAQARGWHCRTRAIDNKASSAKVKSVKTECVWMNYEPPTA